MNAPVRGASAAGVAHERRTGKYGAHQLMMSATPSAHTLHELFADLDVSIIDIATRQNADY